MNQENAKKRKVNPDIELFGLLKVPDSVLLKEALRENRELKVRIGQLESYIEELEERTGGGL